MVAVLIGTTATKEDATIEVVDGMVEITGEVMEVVTVIIGVVTIEAAMEVVATVAEATVAEATVEVVVVIPEEIEGEATEEEEKAVALVEVVPLAAVMHLFAPKLLQEVKVYFMQTVSE